MIPIGVSNRHLHISAGDFHALFGQTQLTPYKPLSQPGQFAAEEKVELRGPKGVLKEVRILGPFRDQTQVELSRTDALRLGVDPPVRDSGHLEATPGLQLVGPRGILTLSRGVILAQRHLHLNPRNASTFGVKDKDLVDILVRSSGSSSSSKRDVVFKEVLVRVSDRYELDLHLDTDEANAAGVSTGDQAELLPRDGTRRGLFVSDSHSRSKKRLITEEDVRLAHRQHRILVLGSEVILTPSARNLGDRLGVFEAGTTDSLPEQG